MTREEKLARARTVVEATREAEEEGGVQRPSQPRQMMSVTVTSPAVWSPIHPTTMTTCSRALTAGPIWLGRSTVPRTRHAHIAA